MSLFCCQELSYFRVASGFDKLSIPDTVARCRDTSRKLDNGHYDYWFLAPDGVDMGGLVDGAPTLVQTNFFQQTLDS